MSSRRTQVHAERKLSTTRRCKLLSLARSSAYYVAKPASEEDLMLMRLIDETHLRLPFYGRRRTRDELEEHGYTVNRKRIKRLMGLRALYPRQRTSQPGKGHRMYPYLLRELCIEHANRVWTTDITDSPMAKGFMYLVAIMDWHTRKVLSWRVSNTLDRDFLSKLWKRPYIALERRTSSTPTKAHSSPPRHSPMCSKTTVSGTAWAAKAAGSIMCFLSCSSFDLI